MTRRPRRPRERNRGAAASSARQASRSRSRPRPPSHTDADLRRLTRARGVFLGVVLLCALLVLLGRLIYLQGTRAPDLRRIARSQQRETFVVPSHRGRIFDRAGRPLVANVEVESVYAVPRLIQDRAAFARRVAAVLGLDPVGLERRLEPHLYFAWVKRKIAPQTADVLRGMGLHGKIGFLKEQRRAYPNGALAAHVLGFVGIDNQGLAGVELSYDGLLQGRPGKGVVGRDAIGRPLIDTRRLAARPVDGADLVVTIDSVIQHVAEAELGRAMAGTRASRGMVLVMDPRSGELLAAAARPTFDPAAFTRVSPARWFNRPIGEVYEPGSTFKLFTVAAGLDAGRVGLRDVFACPPYLTVGRHRIRDAHRYCKTTQTIADIIRHSSNVGAAQVGTKIGKPVLYEYIRRFGFGAPTGIDLPGEGRGIVNPPDAWLGPGLQTIAFGQGISATALQMLTAGSALANGGVLVKPHIVRMVRDREGRVVRAVDAVTVRRVIRPETAQAMVALMIRAVEDGTGKQAAVPGYTVGGKTGTAQKPAPGGGYLSGQFIASFLGFAPVPNPRVAILVVLDSPQGAYYGGAVAAPVFREIAARVLWHLRVPPTAPLTIPPPVPPPGEQP